MTAIAMPAEAPDGGQTGVDVQRATTGEAPTEEDIAGWIEAVLDTVPVRGRGPGAAGRGEVCVRLVDEAESAGLNEQYRRKPGPTNVLSFPADVDVPDGRFWGDLAICVPLVHREAAEQDKSGQAHFAHLVVHGMLHLLGYDHQSAAEADQMESLEKGILDRFGIADPYREG